jgi:tRNA-dihydrouridine synthase B
MLKIGPYKLQNPFILAPMAGVSEMPFRVISLSMGASAAPTELISSKGLLYGQARTARYLTHDPSEQPFWVQIFGGDVESMVAGGRRAIELGARILDINMGCPVRKVTKNGAGSALLCDPSRAADLVRGMSTELGVPITVKIRAGWDDQSKNYVEMGLALQDAGCAAVALHARTRAQGYSGQADWGMITELAAALEVPVIGNGDVRTPADARRMLSETGCSGVMIGRAALGNPWIFSQLRDGNTAVPTPEERWALVQRHLAAHLSFVGNVEMGLRRFRPHLMWYAHGLRGATAFRREAMHLASLDEVQRCCEAFYLGAVPSQEETSEVAFDERGALG